jgi:hypothetical protein
MKIKQLINSAIIVIKNNDKKKAFKHFIKENKKAKQFFFVR